MLLEILIEQNLVTFHRGFVLRLKRCSVSPFCAFCFPYSYYTAIINVLRIMLIIFTTVGGLHCWKKTFMVHTNISDKPKRMVVPPNHFGVMLTDKPQCRVALKRVVEERAELNAAALAKVVADLRIFTPENPRRTSKPIVFAILANF